MTEEQKELYAKAFLRLISGNCHVVFGSIDELKKSPQEEWGRIIVKNSCIADLELVDTF